MANKKQYFYLPDNRLLTVISQFFPADNWINTPGYLISINSTNEVLDLEFASQKVVKLISDALLELLNTDKNDISMKAFLLMIILIRVFYTLFFFITYW